MSMIEFAAAENERSVFTGNGKTAFCVTCDASLGPTCLYLMEHN